METRHATTFAVPVLGLALLAGAAIPVSAAETVIGSTNAQRCYQSATGTGSGLTGIDACGQALEREPLSAPDRAATYVNRGILYSRRGRYEPALKDFSEALRIEPALVHAWINRGNALVRSKRYDEALSDYDQAAFYSEGRNPLVFYNRSLAFEHLGRKAEAREDLVRALQLDPESRKFREALAALD